MYGHKAFLIFVGFLVAAAFLSGGIVAAWRMESKRGGNNIKLIGLTAFVLLWFSLISSVYIRKAYFHFELKELRDSDVYSIQIGRHDFRERAAIEELVGALHNNRWFEVNHGGWGDSIPLTIRRESRGDIVFDVAKYFGEPGAIIGPRNRQGLGYSSTQAFAPDLPQVLAKYGVALPNCDTPHGKPCSAAQLNP